MILSGSPSKPARSPMTVPESELLHEGLVDLLAAYVDGEADDAERARIEAHLVACAGCRALYEQQVAVVRRLAREPEQVVSPAFEARLSDALQRIAHQAPWIDVRPSARSPVRRLARREIIAWSGWAVAAGLAALSLLGQQLPSRATPPSRIEPPVPMVEAAVADFRATMSKEVALSQPDLEALSDEVGFPVAALGDERLQLLGGWSSNLRETRAAVLAYRWGDRVVLQYLVSPELFFRQPAVRNAVRDGGRYLTSTQAHAVVAWAQGASGSLLVSDAPLGEVEQLQL
jgi:anti-sigma factor RsiW